MCQRVQRVVVCTLLVWSSVFAGRALAEPIAGRYRGNWTAAPTKRLPEHGGPLRMRLVATGGNQYQGYFSGRFAKVIPYFYRAHVEMHDGILYSSRNLGRSRRYEMRLVPGPQGYVGTWNAGSHHGQIILRRVR